MDTKTTMKCATPILSWLLSCVGVLHSSILLAESDGSALFATVGKAKANKVAKWDGNRWITSESRMNDIVSVFTMDRSGNLYAKGGEVVGFSRTNANIGSGSSLDESNTPGSNVINNTTTPEITTSLTTPEITTSLTTPEITTSLTTEELFTQAKQAGIFTSVDATIGWLGSHGISLDTLTEEQRNALPIDTNPPVKIGDTAILSDKMGNEAVISLENTVNVLLEPTSSGQSSDEPVEVEAVECASGYVKVGSRLCLSSSLHSGARYRYAEYDCRRRHSGGRVADSTDYFTVQSELGDESFNNYAIKGIWLGPRIADNQALYLNSVRWWDMDGQTSVSDFRYYRCAYDR